MFLSEDELFSLTGKKQYSAQVKALRSMGIEHRVRPDRFVLVSRKHIEKLLDGDSADVRISRRIEPNWEAMNA